MTDNFQPHPEPLVDKDGGLVSPRIFVDHDIYQRELTAIFARCWLYLGHESQLAHPGDFFTTYMGQEPVLVTKAADSSIHAFLNSCRHRGMRICQADEGNASTFTCPYHGWTYGNDGTLRGVPLERELYRNELARERWSLIPVAQLDTYKGLIFATFDPSAPSLLDYLGTMAWYLDTILDRRAGGIEVVGGVHKWRIAANWKIVEDNNSGDEYHVAYSHGSYLRALGALAGEFLRALIHVCPEEGHGFSARFELPDGAAEPYLAIESPALRVAAVRQYFRAVRAEAEQRLGRIRSRVAMFAGTVFPNFSFVPLLSTIRVVHPRGPDHVEVWSWCIVDRDAPPDVKDAIRRAYNQTMGPSGLIEQDDSHNWEFCTASSHSAVRQQYPYNYQMGLGDEHWHEGLRSMITDRLSEATQRSFYRRWAKLMGESV
jgi:3-phenylpropionate/trans-cinnamate dioxygenase subunit alpha